MMQSVIFYGGPDSSHQLNPTQSGGADTFNYGATKRWAGSPVLSQTVVSGSPPYMTTDVRPLNFDHDFFDGNDPWSPLLWRGLFRLTTTVGCKLSGVLQEDVIKIRHEATKDADAPFTTNPVNMFQTSWFLMEPFGDCRSANVQIDLVNTATGAVTPYGSMACNQSFSFPGGADKAIRIVGVNPSLAIGFVRLGTPDGYSASIGAADSQQPPSSQRLVVNGWKFHNLNAGVWEREEVFWVFGTPAGVLSRLMQLRSDGGDCLN
jgi:hypothetical protein